MKFDESFYIAISFLCLLILVSRKFVQWMNSYLANHIDQIDSKINEATEIKDYAQSLFVVAKKELEDFIQIKNNSIAQARKNSDNGKAEYVRNVKLMLQNRHYEFECYLDNLKIIFFEDARTKLADIAHQVEKEAIILEKLEISNKLN
jgi:F0F1-type ATP synthase membrane subunit b/b'